MEQPQITAKSNNERQLAEAACPPGRLDAAIGQ